MLALHLYNLVFRLIRFITFLSFWGKRGIGNLLRYYSDDGPGDCGLGVFIAAEADGVGDKGSEITTSVDVGTLLVAFLVDFHTWGLFLSCRSIRIFGGSTFR